MNLQITDLVDKSIFHTLKSHHDPHDIQIEDVLQSAKILIQSIGNVDFLAGWQPLIDRFLEIRQLYPAIFSHRTSFFWKWIQVAFEIVRLNISPNYFIHDHSLKCRSAMVTYLLDDICDTTQDESCFKRGIAALSGKISKNESDLNTLLYQAWVSVQNDIQKAQNYPLLKNDIVEAYEKQWYSLRYSLTLLDKSAIDWDAYIEFIPHTTSVYMGGLIDLLFTPNILSSQVEQLKKVFLLTQKMAQIGNWVTTWEREVDHNDFTSGVVVFAIENNWVRRGDIKNRNAEALKRDIERSPSENYFLTMWKESREECCQLSKQLDIPLVDEYINSFSTILFMQLASVGLT